MQHLKNATESKTISMKFLEKYFGSETADKT